MWDPETSKDEGGDFAVGIVGAGCAGLFTAMIFDYLNTLTFGKNSKVKLNIKYEILEANKEERVGGRLYSYKFPQKDDKYPIGKHDYYDVGGMRFPDNNMMTKYAVAFILCLLKD